MLCKIRSYHYETVVGRIQCIYCTVAYIQRTQVVHHLSDASFFIILFLLPISLPFKYTL